MYWRGRTAGGVGDGGDGLGMGGVRGNTVLGGGGGGRGENLGGDGRGEGDEG